jgi:hypothetical protein
MESLQNWTSQFMPDFVHRKMQKTPTQQQPLNTVYLMEMLFAKLLKESFNSGPTKVAKKDIEIKKKKCPRSLTGTSFLMCP